MVMETKTLLQFIKGGPKSRVFFLVVVVLLKLFFVLFWGVFDHSRAI